jgi:hypothetical protein
MVASEGGRMSGDWSRTQWWTYLIISTAGWVLVGIYDTTVSSYWCGGLLAANWTVAGLALIHDYATQ